MMEQSHWGCREIQGIDFVWQEGQAVRSNFNSHAMKGTWKIIQNTLE